MDGLVISRLLANFAEVATERAFDWTTADLSPQAGRYAWVSFGILARREPALLLGQPDLGRPKPRGPWAHTALLARCSG